MKKRARALSAVVAALSIALITGPAQAVAGTRTATCSLSSTAYKDARTTWDYSSVTYPSGYTINYVYPLNVGFGVGNAAGQTQTIYKFEARMYDSNGFIDSVGTWVVNAKSASKAVTSYSVDRTKNPYMRIQLFNSSGTVRCTARVSD